MHLVVQGERILQSILSLLGPCARLTPAACKTVQRVQRLFFLNEGQGLSNFLTLDLGFLKYPSFRVNRSRRVFPNRAKLLEYESALKEAAALDDALEVIKRISRLGLEGIPCSFSLIKTNALGTNLGSLLSSINANHIISSSH